MLTVIGLWRLHVLSGLLGHIAPISVSVLIAAAMASVLVSDLMTMVQLMVRPGADPRVTIR